MAEFRIAFSSLNSFDGLIRVLKQEGIISTSPVSGMVCEPFMMVPQGSFPTK